MKPHMIVSISATVAKLMSEMPDGYVPCAMIGYLKNGDVLEPVLLPLGQGQDGYDVGHRCLTDCSIGSAMNPVKVELSDFKNRSDGDSI